MNEIYSMQYIIYIKKNRSDEIGNIDLFYFPENSRKSLISPEFIDKLKKYDVLILSGGYTAYFFLNSSGFISIENKESIMPLVSIGVIHGGILNNKIVILKGGSIGNNDIYLKIIKTLDADTVNSPHE